MRMDNRETELRALLAVVHDAIDNGALAAASEAALKLAGRIEDYRAELEQGIVSDMAELFFATGVIHV